MKGERGGGRETSRKKAERRHVLLAWLVRQYIRGDCGNGCDSTDYVRSYYARRSPDWQYQLCKQRVEKRVKALQVEACQ